MRKSEYNYVECKGEIILDVVDDDDIVMTLRRSK